MKTFIKERLKKFPGLYSFLIYEKSKVHHRLLNQQRSRTIPATINSLLKDIDLKPQYIKKNKPRGSLVEITNACNLNCLMCNTKMSKRPIGFIEPRVFELILQQLILSSMQFDNNNLFRVSYVIQL